MAIKRFSFDQICRLCMNSSTKLKSLFSYKSKKHLTESKLCNKIEECISLQVRDGDGLPSFICLKCIYLLNSFYQFRNRCFETHSKLLKCIENGENSVEIDQKKRRKAKTKLSEISHEIKDEKYEEPVGDFNADERFYYDDDQKIDLFDEKIMIDDIKPTLSTLSSIDNFFQGSVKTESDDVQKNNPFVAINSAEKVNADNFAKLLKKRTSKNRKATLKKRNVIKSENLSEIKIEDLIKQEDEDYEPFEFDSVPNKHKKRQCGICGKFLSYLTKMNIHMRIHTGEKPFFCDVCGKKFSRAEHVARHKLIHSGQKPFACKICDKTFLQPTALKSHMSIHTGEKPHICTVCGKSFRQAITLQRHMRTHTGEKPFVCSVCNKGFTHSGNLNVHMRYHTNLRPFSCDRCDKHFFTLSHLQVHIKKHDGIKDHECQICERRFAHRQHLKDHIVTHTGDKPHQCALCQKKYVQRSHLNYHIKRSHSDHKYALPKKPILVVGS